MSVRIDCMFLVVSHGVFSNPANAQSMLIDPVVGKNSRRSRKSTLAPTTDESGKVDRGLSTNTSESSVGGAGSLNHQCAVEC